MSDVVMVNGEGDNESAPDDNDAGSEFDGGEESSDGSDNAHSASDEELAVFDAKLAEALGTGRAVDNEAAGNANQSSDEDMTDEQMAALDTHLENIFKERKKVVSKKAEKKGAKETIVNFKLRVLDLLQIYVKQQHTNPLALELILPLLLLIRTTASKQVSEKACNVVRELARLCKGKAVPVPGDAQKTWDMLKEVHKEAMRQSSNAHANACSQSSLLLVKSLVALNRENIRGVIDIYADTRKQQFLDKRCHIQPGLFSDWNNWCTSASKQQQ